LYDVTPGAIWRQPQKLREITFRDSQRLAIEDRIAENGQAQVCRCRYVPAYGAMQMQMLQYIDGCFLDVSFAA
jgi:hypothetical protein